MRRSGALHDERRSVDGKLIAVRELATSLARNSKVAVSAWVWVSPKPTIASRRLASTLVKDGGDAFAFAISRSFPFTRRIAALRPSSSTQSVVLADQSHSYPHLQN
jgi:hypothetical protein